MSSAVRLLPFLFVFLCMYSGISAQSKSEQKILDVLENQENAGNTGDLDKFMIGYWESDSLMFIGKSGLTYGYNNTLKNYKRSYPDKAAMGKLEFTILKMEKLGSKNYLVVGKWLLTRKEDAPNGHFSLIWRKIKGEWVIVADHSS